MEQLEVIIKDDVAKMIPAMIAWNNEELLERVQNEILPRYMNLVYTDEDITQAKEDRAALNAWIKSLDEKRLEIKKIYSGPLDKFTEQVKEVIAAVKQAIDRIGEIITTHDNKAKAEKKAEIVKYFNEVIGDLADLVPYEKIEDTKWYNATSKFKATAKAIDEKVGKIREDLTVIDSLGAADTDGLKLFYFRTLNLAQTIEENKRLKEDRAKVAELNAAQRAENSDSEETEITIRFEVKGSAEDFQKLAAFLNENNIEYRKIED